VRAARDFPLLKMPEGTILASQPPGIRGMSVHMPSGTRRFVLAAVAIGIPVLWAFVPYAYRVGEMQYMTFGSITFGRPIFLGLWVPLYPALQAARLLVAPSRLAARRITQFFDREIAETIGPHLVKAGIVFAGLDVIGDWLTEVNVTSPTCIVEIAQQTGRNAAVDLLDALERARGAAPS